MTQSYPRPSLLRHLMVMLYDLLLLLSALLFAAAIAVAAHGGEAITANNPFFSFYLLMVSLFFFSWFWTHGGQTLGMRAWKVFLVNPDQSPISWKQAGLRFVAALLSWLCLGYGFWCQWLGQKSWPDALSGTQLIVIKDKQ